MVLRPNSNCLDGYLKISNLLWPKFRGVLRRCLEIEGRGGPYLHNKWSRTRVKFEVIVVRGGKIETKSHT